MWENYWKRFTKETADGKRKGDGILFEDLIRCLLNAKYGARWKRTAKSYDDNRDFWIFLEDNHIWAECKNYAHSISMDILSPTLVMAQVYDVNMILFFSRSAINERAKSKILAFGAKAEKLIQFYDAEVLERLIWELRDKLPKKFKPLVDNVPDEPSDLNISLMFSQDAVNGVFETDECFVDYESAELVRYNEVFGLSFYLSNPFPNVPLRIKLAFSSDEADRFCFEYLNAGITSEQKIWFEKDFQGGEGCAVILNLRPIIFKPKLKLPRFTLDGYSDDGTRHFQWSSKSVTVRCHWIGQTKLIGHQYENLLGRIGAQLVQNSRLSVLALVGNSGTGKTRMLTESETLYLKYGYSILRINGTSTKGDSTSSFFLRELIAFLYEIPGAVIQERLELRFSSDETDSDLEELPKDQIAIKMLKAIGQIDSEDGALLFVDKYGSLLFEKLASQKCALIVDNVQFSTQAIHEFLRKFILYSLSRNRPVFSALLLAFNQDFMTATTSEFLFDIMHADIPHLISEKIAGFQEMGLGVLFLRELVRVHDEGHDKLFQEIIARTSLNPYHLFQTVKYLEENQAVKVRPNGQGFILEDDRAWRCIGSLPDGIMDILKKRWQHLADNRSEDRLFHICSALFLFNKIDIVCKKVFEIEDADLSYLAKRSFLRESNGVYVFDHDIIRTFFTSSFPEHRLDCLRWLLQHGNADVLLAHQQVYDFYRISIVKDDQYTFTFLKKIDGYYVSPRLASAFYRELFGRCIEIGEFFEDKALWIERQNDICKQIRSVDGSEAALEFYLQGHSAVKRELGRSVYERYAGAYRSFLHFYCDILVELHRREEAEELISSILRESENIQAENQRNADETLALRAIMYNRWYVTYNNADPTSEISIKRRNLMASSRRLISQIQNKQLKKLVEYLNNSDEGYNYYGYYRDKKQLLSIWDQCLVGMPDSAPEKTLNYYRKKIQYDLIAQEFNATLRDIEEGRTYLNEGIYSHEPLIFNTFFLMAEIMAYLQTYPAQYIEYIERLLSELVQIQHLLENGKMGDILLLRGVSAFYSQNPDETYYAFRRAYEHYTQGNTSRHWIKKALLLENIWVSFSVLDVYSCAYDMEFLPIRYRYAASEEALSTYQASGIQRTGDLLMNLPLI